MEVAKARLSPHLSKCHIVGNHMSRSIIDKAIHLGTHDISIKVYIEVPSLWGRAVNDLTRL